MLFRCGRVSEGCPLQVSVLWPDPLVAQKVKRLPAVWETRVRSLGWDDSLEKEMATHSSILAWKSHGWRSMVGYSPWGRRGGHDWATSLTSLRFPAYRLLINIQGFMFHVLTSMKSGEASTHWNMWTCLCSWGSPGHGTLPQQFLRGPLAPSWTCVLCSARCAETPPLWPRSPLPLPPAVCCGQSVAQL